MTDPTSSESRMIVIGAGISGLTCAALLTEAGHPVLLLDAADGIGGRVRTDRDPDGFLLDRGFQVILEAYPAVRRQCDLAALQPGRFDAGAMVWTGRRLIPVADPRRHPGALLRDLTSPIFPLSDKARLMLVAAGSRLAAWESARDAGLDDRHTAEQALRVAGFSDRFVDRFARPFWGGITLDPSLRSSAGPLKFTLKMFLQGAAVLPAQGVQAVPEQIARRLPPGTIETGRRIDRIAIDDGTVSGVVVAGGTIAARTVVVAADPVTARALTGIESIPTDGVGCVTVFLRGRREPGVGKRLVLDGTGQRTINHVAPLSTVAPTYAPAGESLIAAVFVGDAIAEPDDEKLATVARADVGLMLGHDPTDWSVARVARVPFSQFAQPPGMYRRLPGVRTDTTGLYLAGEATVDSSLNGAIIAGELAAKAVLEDRNR